MGAVFICSFRVSFVLHLALTFLKPFLERPFWALTTVLPVFRFISFPDPVFFFFLNHFQVPEVGTFLQA